MPAQFNRTRPATTSTAPIPNFLHMLLTLERTPKRCSGDHGPAGRAPSLGSYSRPVVPHLSAAGKFFQKPPRPKEKRPGRHLNRPGRSTSVKLRSVDHDVVRHHRRVVLRLERGLRPRVAGLAD